jgi:hypothetical protein
MKQSSKLQLNTLASLLASCALLSACGGGSGSGSSNATEAAALSAVTSTTESSSTVASTSSDSSASATSTTTTDTSSTTASTSTASTSTTATAAAATAAITATASTDSSAPHIFNAPLSTRAGDIVSIQGDNFGTAPKAKLIAKDGSVIQTLDATSTYGAIAATFQIPSTATGPLQIKVNNGTLDSALIKLNAAVPHHLDARQIAPGGAFRIFGRSLLVSGYTPVVKVGGLSATVNVANSNEHMLTVTAPTGITASSSAVITVDNGNGTGASTLDRTTEIATGSSADPFSLGVGWASAFTSIASKVVAANSDAKLSKKVVCNGTTDDTAAIQAAVVYVNSVGGGIVQLPAGTCIVNGSVQLLSKVVLQGASKTGTIISYSKVRPVWGKGLDLAGIRNMSFVNNTPNIESPQLVNGTRSFVQNVSFQLNGGNQMFLSGNKNFVVTNSDFIQPKNTNMNSLLVIGGSSGLVFTNNSITSAQGTSNFSKVSDAYISGNVFTRDIRDNQNGSYVYHGISLDFAHRVAVTNNTFNVQGGPVTNKTRNDGETILTEGGGSSRTENYGTVASATATTLYDPSNTINVTPFSTDVIPENYGVAIVGGKGAGQSRRVTGYSSGTLSIEKAWDVIPDTSSRYATFVWGIEKSIIKGNILSQNPRGIWIYCTAARELDIIGNNISEGGGIYIRSDQRLTSKIFTPHYGIRIANNSISNTTGEWRSYIDVHFYRVSESTDFGFSNILTEVRSNSIVANSPNLVQTQEVAGSSEGIELTMYTQGTSQAISTSQTRIIGAVVQGNTCKNCNAAVQVGIAAKAIVQ